MNDRNDQDDMLIKLSDVSTDILVKNRIALLLSESKDERVVKVLHQLIDTEAYVNCRGTFVYCLLNFSGVLSFKLAINLLINGNFEVAHHAFEIVNSIDEGISGAKVDSAFKKLVEFLDSDQEIEDWRRSLVKDILEMFD